MLTHLLPWLFWADSQHNHPAVSCFIESPSRPEGYKIFEQPDRNFVDATAQSIRHRNTKTRPTQYHRRPIIMHQRHPSSQTQTHLTLWPWEKRRMMPDDRYWISFVDTDPSFPLLCTFWSAHYFINFIPEMKLIRVNRRRRGYLGFIKLLRLAIRLDWGQKIQIICE